MSYRSQNQEIDYAGFTSNTISETGAMVIKSKKGTNVPVRCQSENDILLYFGTPSATYPEVFEAIAFCRKAPAWVSSALGSGCLYGGVDVRKTTIVPFVTGRDYSTYSYGGDTDTSHSFFAYSPCTDDLAISVKYVSGTKYQATLYQKVATGNQYITYYDYSLTAEKDGYGRSLYYDDVFNQNPYVKLKINSSWASGTITLPGTSVYSFNGGTRGTDPTTASYTTAWNYFQAVNKYKAKIFMDCNGGSANTILSLVTNYQKWGHAITCMPLGKTASTAVTYRQGLGINSDKISIYSNWMKIQDDYNDSMAWITHVGSIGGKYAQMYDCYDAAAPAGIDENNHGGLISDWRILEVENDYTDYDVGLGSDLQILNEAQINPLIFDEADGLKIYGDKTMLSTNTDTSFIGTRRMYNYIEETIQTQILRKQEFKINDPLHRLKAKIMTVSFLEPILNGGWIREAVVVCDTSNNTNAVLDRREFVLDIYIKVTPTSEFVRLRLIRVAQNMSITELQAGISPS